MSASPQGQVGGGEVGEEAVVVGGEESVASDGLDDACVDLARASVFFVELGQGRGFVTQGHTTVRRAFPAIPNSSNNTSKPTTMTSTLFTMINKKRNSSSPPSYTLENPTATLSEQFESSVSRSFSQIAAGFRASTSHAPTPLAQLQNLQEPSPQLPKKAASTKRHGPSPPNLGPAEAKLAVASPGHADPDPDANVFLDNGMDLDTEFTPRSAIQRQGRTGPSYSNDNVSSKPLEILSSQEAEVELIINLDNDSGAASDETNPPPAASAQPSPFKAWCNAGAAGMKVSLLGLTDDGSDFSGVPKMESPESDTIVKGLNARLSSPTSPHTSTSNEVNTRRSMRHPPNRGVKVELFRDDSPGPSTPRITFKPKPQSNVTCPLDMFLADNRRGEARKAGVEGKCDTVAWTAEASVSDGSDISLL
ncbi:hypothetical protein BU17DRAFT_97844 [Hysterangium stoloniferum]|nr:hypothetical protein BU17DRAFT_97844 [Hysterangium stoloniferum]